MGFSFRAVSIPLVAALVGCVEGGGLDDGAPSLPPDVAIDAGKPAPGGVVDFTAAVETPEALPFCDLDFTPDEIRFGIVDHGTTATIEVALRNDGEGPCVVRNLQLCEDTDQAWSLPGGPYPLVYVPAGAEYRLPLHFAPDEGTCREGPEGCLEADVGPGPDGHRSWTLDCAAATPAPPVLLAPDAVDFGSARPGCDTRERELTIVNVSSAPIEVASVELAEGTPDSFVILSAPQPGTVIPPGLEALVTLAFRPEDAGVVEGAAFVTIAGYPEPIEATLRGGGIGPTTWRDTFGGTGERACFALVYPPEDTNGDGACSDVDGELQVFVDGTLVPSTVSGEPAWAYDTVQDALCFAAGHVPADGARIELVYRIACLPW